MRCLYIYLYTQACTQIDFKCMNMPPTSVSTPYDPNQALQTPQRDVNIIVKPRRSSAFLSQSLRKCIHSFSKGNSNPRASKKSAFFGWQCSFSAEVISKALGGACGSFRSWQKDAPLSRAQPAQVPGGSSFLHQGTVTVILFLCPLQLWTLFSLEFLTPQVPRLDLRGS